MPRRPLIPLTTDGPRSQRLLPKGVARESLAVLKPATSTIERAQELAQQVAAGDMTMALSELGRHAGKLVERPPALEIVYQAVLAGLLPEQATVADYAGRLFYCLRLEDRPQAVELSAGSQEHLDRETRQGLAQAFATGRGTLDGAVKAGLERGLLETIWREAATAVEERGRAFVQESWLEPTRLDYVFDEGGLAMDLPSAEQLIEAFAGYPQLIGPDEDELRVLSVQMVKRHVLPRLLARRWPQVVAKAEAIAKDEPLFLQNREDLAVAIEAARTLLDDGF